MVPATEARYEPTVDHVEEYHTAPYDESTLRSNAQLALTFQLLSVGDGHNSSFSNPSFSFLLPIGDYDDELHRDSRGRSSGQRTPLPSSHANDGLLAAPLGRPMVLRGTVPKGIHRYAFLELDDGSESEHPEHHAGEDSEVSPVSEAATITQDMPPASTTTVLRLASLNSVPVELPSLAVADKGWAATHMEEMLGVNPAANDTPFPTTPDRQHLRGAVWPKQPTKDVKGGWRPVPGLAGGHTPAAVAPVSNTQSMVDVQYSPKSPPDTPTRGLLHRLRRTLLTPPNTRGELAALDEVAETASAGRRHGKPAAAAASRKSSTASSDAPSNISSAGYTSSVSIGNTSNRSRQTDTSGRSRDSRSTTSSRRSLAFQRTSSRVLPTTPDQDTSIPGAAVPSDHTPLVAFAPTTPPSAHGWGGGPPPSPAGSTMGGLALGKRITVWASGLLTSSKRRLSMEGATTNAVPA